MEVFFMQCTLLLTEMKKNDEELSQKIVRLKKKKRSLNRRLAFGYTGQREKMNIEKRIFYYEFAML